MNINILTSQMRTHAKNHVSEHYNNQTGEVNTTALYEDICFAFKLEDGSDADSMASDIAVEEAERYEKESN